MNPGYRNFRNLYSIFVAPVEVISFLKLVQKSCISWYRVNKLYYSGIFHQVNTDSPNYNCNSTEEN